MQLHDTGFNEGFFMDLMEGEDICAVASKETEPFREEPIHVTDPRSESSVPCRRIPCKARSLSSTHDADNAFFDVPVNAPHGLLLCCSHPECAASGRRFRYCQVCALPAAKRNFLKRHGHGLIDSSKELKEDVDEVCGVILSHPSGPTQIVSRSSSQPVRKPQHRRAHSCNQTQSSINPFNLNTISDVPHQTSRHRSFSGGEDMTFDQKVVPRPKKQHRRMMSFDGVTSSSGHKVQNDNSFSDLSSGEKQWLSLLNQRPELDDQSGMSEWMDRVLLFSEGKRLHEAASPTNITSAPPPPMLDPLNLLPPPVPAPVAEAPPALMRLSPSLPSLPEHERVVAPKPDTVGDALVLESLYPEMSFETTFGVHPVSPEDHPAVVSMPDSMDVDNEPLALSDLPFKPIPANVYASQESVDSSIGSSASGLASKSEMGNHQADTTQQDQEEDITPLDHKVDTTPLDHNTEISHDELASIIGHAPSFALPTN